MSPQKSRGKYAAEIATGNAEHANVAASRNSALASSAADAQISKLQSKKDAAVGAKPVLPVPAQKKEASK